MFNSSINHITQHKHVVILLVLVVVSRVLMYQTIGETSDDPYITYRYAENIAAGKGFVFNPGERVLGTSSPLYTLLLSAVAWVVRSESIPAASRLISLVADVVSVMLLWQIVAPFARMTARFLTVSLYALYPKVLLIAISGMEACFVVMLMLSSYFLLEKRKTIAAYVVFGLLLITRIDTIAWVVTCAVWFAVRQKRVPVNGIVAMVIVCLPWFIFSTTYFGTWIPHSVIAKRVSWGHLFPVFDPVRILAGYFPFRALLGFPQWVFAIAVTVFLIPVVVELIRTIKGEDRFAMFILFFLFYNLAFSFGRVLMPDWYFLPGFVGYFVLFGRFIDGFLVKGKEMSNEGNLRFPILGALIFLLLGLDVIGAMRWKEEPHGLFSRNQQLGIWLRDNAPKESNIMLEPIGYIGWESKLYVHDYFGLVSLAVVKYRRAYAGSDSWYMKYVEDVQPDFVVLRKWEIEGDTLFLGHAQRLFEDQIEREWFEKNYIEIPWNAAMRNDWDYLTLFGRRSFWQHFAEGKQ